MKSQSFIPYEEILVEDHPLILVKLLNYSETKWSENDPNYPMEESNWSWNNQSLEYLLLLIGRILDGF